MGIQPSLGMEKSGNYKTLLANFTYLQPYVTQSHKTAHQKSLRTLSVGNLGTIPWEGKRRGILHSMLITGLAQQKHTVPRDLTAGTAHLT